MLCSHCTETEMSCKKCIFWQKHFCENALSQCLLLLAYLDILGLLHFSQGPLVLPSATQCLPQYFLVFQTGGGVWQPLTSQQLIILWCWWSASTLFEITSTFYVKYLCL